MLLLVAGSGVPSAVLRKHMRAIGAALNEGERQKLETLLASGRPTMVATVEMVVVAIIIFLMVFKP